MLNIGLNKGTIMLCYIILNYNDSETTISCVNSIWSYDIIDKIIVVDNKSTDRSLERLLSIANERVDVIQTNYNGGYGYGNNYGIRHAQKEYNPDYIVISNPDVEIQLESLQQCLSFHDNNADVAVVVPLMIDRTGKECFDCVWKLPTYYQYLLFSLAFLRNAVPTTKYKPEEIRNSEHFKCDCVAGSWFMAKTDALVNAGLYDENIFLYCEETVLGIKMHQKNYNCYLLPKVTFKHNHSISISKTIKSRYKQQKLMWKSRIYVLDNYFGKPKYYKPLNRLIGIVGLTEWRFLECIKKLLRRK